MGRVRGWRERPSGRASPALASIAVAGVAMAAFALMSASPRQRGTAAAQVVTQVELAGRTLYLRDCAWCHGNGAESTERGPKLIGLGAADADFWLSTGRMPITREDEVPRRGPPAYPPGQIRQIVAYIGSLGGPPVPSVDPATGRLAEGATIYEDQCAACHSSTGTGGALPRVQAPNVLTSSPVQIAEAVRLGPTAMPVFDSSVISAEQLNSVIAYVQRLQSGEDRGGASLGRLGPVAEGFIAWFAGVLALVVVIWWIGTRSTA